MSTSKRDRWLVFGGIVAAWIASAAFIRTGVVLTDGMAMFRHRSAPEAMAFAMLGAAIPLVAGIGLAARLRFLGSDIDGSRPEAGSGLDLALRFVSNTTEQLLLFCIACLGATVLAPDIAPTLLPVMAVWFLLARAAFFIGYQLHPLARAAGFAATFHPTIALMIYVLAAALH